MSEKAKAFLEHWAVISRSGNPFLNGTDSPVEVMLVGVVSDHPKLPDGTKIATSTLTYISYSKRLAVTLNTNYYLGKPSEDFVRYLDENGYSIEEYESGIAGNA